METTHSVAASAPVSTASHRLIAPLAALALGLTIIFAVGFVQGPNAAVHNAAHNPRHAFAFPCH